MLLLSLSPRCLPVQLIFGYIKKEADLITLYDMQKFDSISLQFHIFFI